MARLLALLLAVLLPACGGGGSDGGGGTSGGNQPGGGNNPGTGTSTLAVTGSALAFTPSGFVAFSSTGSPCRVGGTTSSSSVVAVLATSYPLACGAVAENRASSTQLLMAVSRVRTDGQPAAPIAPGAFVIGQDPGPGEPRAFVQVLRKAADCSIDLPASFPGGAISGTVTLTTVGATIEGSVDALLYGGDRVLGNFAIPPCSAATGADSACAAAGGPAVTAGECKP